MHRADIRCITNTLKTPANDGYAGQAAANKVWQRMQLGINNYSARQTSTTNTPSSISNGMIKLGPPITWAME